MQGTANKLMINGRMSDGSDVTVPTGSGLLYEVIRIMDRTPLFFNEHYARFVNTALAREALQVPGYEDFRRMTDAFLQSQAASDYNIKILFSPATADLYILESPSAYPDAALYRTGIHTELLTYMRTDPNSKITNTELTDLAGQLKKASGAYEVLLVNAAGSITEGSKSNLFFLKDNVLITPPLEEVLPGVTRQKIIDTAQHINIKVIESDIKTEDLHRYKGAFMSGTSPKILPIASIGKLSLNSAQLPLIKTLMLEFDETIQKDLANYRQAGPAFL